MRRKVRLNKKLANPKQMKMKEKKQMAKIIK